MNDVESTKTQRLYKKLSKNKLWNYKIYFFSYFLAQGAYLPLYPIYLKNVAQISEGLTGTILSINPLISILLQPLWGILNERFNLNKRLLFISIAAINVASVIILLSHQITPRITFATTYTFIVLFSSLYGIFACSITPLHDSIALKYVKKYGYQYGDVRIFGSIGYALGAFLSGQLVSLWGYNALIILCSLFYGISLFSLLRMKQVRVVMERDPVNKESNFKVLFKNKSFVVFLLFIAFSHGVLSPSGNFLFLYLEKSGGGEDIVGLGTSLIVVIEIIVMLAVLKVNKRFSDLTLLMWAIILQIPVLITFILTDNIYVLLTVFIFRGASNGLLIPVMVSLISSIVHPKQLSLGLSVYSALSVGLTGFIVSATGGFIIERFSYGVFFFLMLLSITFSLFLGIYLGKVRKHVIIQF